METAVEVAVVAAAAIFSCVGDSTGGADAAPEAFLPRVPRLGVVVMEVDSDGGGRGGFPSVSASSSLRRRRDRGDAGMRGDARTRGEGGRRAGLVEGGVISSFVSSFGFSSVVVFEDCVLGERPRRDRVVAGGGDDVGDFVTVKERKRNLFY